MPFLKHNDPSTQVADANDTSHKCLWVALPNAELNKQLRTCTQAFAEWVGVDPNMGFAYRDMAAWTAEVAGIAGDMDRRSYLQWYFGIALGAHRACLRPRRIAPHRGRVDAQCSAT